MVLECLIWSGIQFLPGKYLFWMVVLGNCLWNLYSVSDELPPLLSPSVDREDQSIRLVPPPQAFKYEQFLVKSVTS